MLSEYGQIISYLVTMVVRYFHQIWQTSAVTMVIQVIPTISVIVHCNHGDRHNIRLAVLDLCSEYGCSPHIP